MPKTAPIVIESAIRIELPYPGDAISKNHMYNSGKRSQGLTPAASAWKTTLVEWLQYFPFYRMSSYVVPPVGVEIGGRFTDGKHRPDLHNLTELVCDAIQEAIGVNDKHFEVLTRQPEMGAAEPVVLVTVKIRMEM